MTPWTTTFWPVLGVEESTQLSRSHSRSDGNLIRRDIPIYSQLQKCERRKPGATLWIILGLFIVIAFRVAFAVPQGIRTTFSSFTCRGLSGVQIRSFRPLVSNIHAPSSAKRCVHECPEPIHRILGIGLCSRACGANAHRMTHRLVKRTTWWNLDYPAANIRSSNYFESTSRQEETKVCVDGESCRCIWVQLGMGAHMTVSEWPEQEHQALPLWSSWKLRERHIEAWTKDVARKGNAMMSDNHREDLYYVSV